MDTRQILAIYRQIQSTKKPTILKPSTTKNPHVRPNSASITGSNFGDEGKGSVIVKFNAIFQKKSKSGKIYSLSPNGGSNAGHEALINGHLVVTHQLPIAITQEGATAFITRGKVLAPEDLLFEMQEVSERLGTKLPGKLLIDSHTPLAIDTYRAYELALNSRTTGGRGSTGRGIATAYASFYERTIPRVEDLLKDDWKSTFRKHYHFYRERMTGFGDEFLLEKIPVTTLNPLYNDANHKRPVGSVSEFLDRLEEARSQIKKYVAVNTMELLQKAWNDIKTPFTIEFAQGAGLDPYHGVYPDVTGSRPLTRFIGDATYGIIQADAIAYPTAVLKWYMSSVGVRELPTKMSSKKISEIQTRNKESGRSTGRLRDIRELSLPILRYLRRADGYRYLTTTHLDSVKTSDAISIVTHYTDRTSKKEAPYSPYQAEIDKLIPHTIVFEGWDGNEVKRAKSVNDLPLATKRFLAFISQTVAPIIMGTRGANRGDYLLFTNNL